MDVHAPLPSPGVGARRKGPKALPTLDASAFPPPNTGFSDKFPLPSSPSSIHPEKIIDANVVIRDAQLSQWKSGALSTLGKKASGVVVSLAGVAAEDVENIIESLRSNAPEIPILAVLVPFPLENGVPSSLPAFIASSLKTPIHLIASYAKTSEKQTQGIKWALEKGHVVEIDVQGTVGEGDASWDGLEDLIGKLSKDEKEEKDSTTAERKGTIVLSNILPPPDSLTLPIVKLLTHPAYTEYTFRLGSLSLSSNVYLKFLPPMWGEPTPSGSQDQKEWKRRIKMYLGPAVLAFGFQRIIFGSSPSPASTHKSNASDWYELARESMIELGLEQDGIDAILGSNAQNVYEEKV